MSILRPNLISIAGIAITLLLGLIAVYLAIRRARYPTKLLFLHNQPFWLVNSVSGKIPNVSIRHAETEIGEDAFVINGIIINSGDQDLSESDIDSPLKFMLPDGYKWLEVSAKSKYFPVEAQVYNDKELLFGFKLLKRDESFSFAALAVSESEETKNEKVLSSLINKSQWTHRINGLGKITFLEASGGKKTSVFMEYFLLILCSIMVLISCFGLYAVISELNSNAGFLSRTSYGYDSDGKFSTIEHIRKADETSDYIADTYDVMLVDSHALTADQLSNSKLYTSEWYKQYFSVAVMFFLLVAVLFMTYFLYVKVVKPDRLIRIHSMEGKNLTKP